MLIHRPWHTYENEEVRGEKQVLDHVGQEPVHGEAFDKSPRSVE